MNFIKIIVPIICVFLLTTSPSYADGENAPEDKTTKQNIDDEIQLLEDFTQGLKRVRDSSGNVSFGQCIAIARRLRIECQQNAQDGVGSEECYLEEDSRREWCARAWDNILP
ncbi:hypothetical protein [Pseudovibrio brasiliensis]|uniref:Secreted protein n=1 Tax=Pseudovibrio brasiliensis TaxID=1898042 RepID=A0ABX8AZJ3_9HYPH|nr:hypothetical protein [Pseudovibrio brasiliensis]QUS59071.1 hypothetical protein KGB56_26000 [Pseudovibrio brasiliensis]